MLPGMFPAMFLGESDAGWLALHGVMKSVLIVVKIHGIRHGAYRN